MGQLHVLAAVALGAQVYGSDFVEERRTIAQANGAVAFHPDEIERVLPEGADVVICGPGSVPAMQAAVQATAGGGTIVMFTPFPPRSR